MPSFQARASKIFKAFFLLRGNSNSFEQFGSKVRSRFIDSAEEGLGKSKGKVTPLTSNNNFKRARLFKRSHYINTFNIHKL